MMYRHLARLFKYDTHTKKRLLENTKQIIFIMIQILYAGGQSTALFISNSPEAFQKFGAVIIVWSIINISMNRSRYAATIGEWDRSLLVRLHRYQRAIDRFKEDALVRTFNLHASQIAQILFHLGKENPFIPANNESIREFCKAIEDDFKNFDSSDQGWNDLHREFEDFHEEYLEETQNIKSWENLLLKIEVILLCWGTLQTAYGADFVTILKSSLS